MIFIKDLIPTHNTLRSKSSFFYFYNHFKLYKELTFGLSNKISIVETEDGKKYIWDSHHRLCAIFALKFIDYIPDEYYTIHNLTYEKVLTVNFKKGFVTPFNLKKECRIPDFSNFKNGIISNISNDKSLVWNEFYIWKNRHLYSELRKVNNIEDLIKASNLEGIND